MPLTKEGLFSYFEPRVIREIIELPLVTRYLSVHDYWECKTRVEGVEEDPHLAHVNNQPIDVILDFDQLRQAPKDEVSQYLGVDKIREAYTHYFGEYFLNFEKELATVYYGFDKPPDVTLSLDLISEKKLMLHIQAAIALPLQAFTNAILDQDVLLQEIASQLTYQAYQAKIFIMAIQESDIRYKQNVIGLAFSVIKIGLSVFHVDQLVNVSQALSSLASGAFEEIGNKLSSVVADIEHLVVNTHLKVLQDAEKELLSTSAPEDITLRWAMYRARIFSSANKSIKHVLDSCINKDDFFRCIIRATIAKDQCSTEDVLLIQATEKARQHVTDIAKGLDNQVAKIRHIRDAVMSVEGCKKIEYYFRKICLINYAMGHEKSGGTTQKWLTKKLGDHLAYYFPDVVWQKHWFANKSAHHHDNIDEKLSREESEKRRKNSPVILGLFRNSNRVRRVLFECLEEQIPHLSDTLVQELQEQTLTEPTEDIFLADREELGNSARYCFRQRKLSLFSFKEPRPDHAVARALPAIESEIIGSEPLGKKFKTEKKGHNAVLLLSQRSFNPL